LSKDSTDRKPIDLAIYLPAYTRNKTLS